MKKTIGDLFAEEHIEGMKSAKKAYKQFFKDTEQAIKESETK